MRSKAIALVPTIILSCRASGNNPLKRFVVDPLWFEQPGFDEMVDYDPPRKTMASMDRFLVQSCRNKQTYINWIIHEYWPQLEFALRVNLYKLRAIIRYLKKRHKIPNHPKKSRI